MIFANGKLVLGETGQPALPETWARIRVRSAGLCGTDIAKYSAPLPAQHTSVLGHEFVGHVEELLGDADGLAKGDLVAGTPLLSCGWCHNCLQGHTNLCTQGKAIGRTESGAFAELLDVPVSNLHKINGSNPDIYVLVDPLAVCVHAMRFVPAASNRRRCLVIGDGTIACLQAWLLIQGGDEVWMAGKHQAHLDFMSKFGVRTFLSAEDGINSFDAVFEAVGRAQSDTLTLAVHHVRPKGHIVVVGVFEPNYLLPVEVRKIFIKEATLVGTNAYTRDEFFTACDLIARHETELAEFITHWFPVSELNTAIKTARTKEGLVLKVVLNNDLSSSKIKKEQGVITVQDLHEAFNRTTEEILSLEEWKLALSSGKKLRVKYGVDVTAPYLHIGHAVNLWMMRKLQDMGHCVVFLIGDFTTQIGDPTGKNKLRPVISKEEIESNVDAFIEQAKMVLRFDSPELLEIRRNSEWYDSMKLPEFLRLVSLVTHSRLVSREMFQRRIKDGDDIYMHELLYPVLQGYDSFMLDADLTIIGSDQLFNEMMGRFYQEKFGQRPQVIITTKITPGIDGKAKQSKSLGNYVGLGHSPRDKFGRLMSLPDSLVVQYAEVYTELPAAGLDELKTLIESDPFEAKKRMAVAITSRYHGEEVAAVERAWFEETFSARKVPKDIPEVVLDKLPLSAVELLRLCFGTERSTNELRRLIQQGAFSLDEVKVTDPQESLSPTKGQVLRVGKRNWFRIG